MTAKIDPSFSIGGLARATGCSGPTIRYYESVGLIPKARRRPSGHRFYDGRSLEALRFIRRCRTFGFSVDQVRQLTTLLGRNGADCVEARDIAREHLMVVRAKLSEMRALEEVLAAFVQSCTQTCLGGAPRDCTILKELTASASLPKRCCG